MVHMQDGDFNESSDIDIMILTDLSNDEIVEYRDKIWDYAYDIESDNNFDIDLSPLVKNIDSYNKRIEVVPFYMNVKKEGVVLYGDEVNPYAFAKYRLERAKEDLSDAKYSYKDKRYLSANNSYVKSISYFFLKKI